ncbi:MAG: hypothetical protein K0B11_06465 [Mariniphaga sp.]|nr:hypothetical protein [Mariniphaga sp.]
MGKLSENHLLYGFLSVFILLQFYLLLFSDSAYGYGGADNIAHYQIARYSFKYPELFLDLWGKPVYTTLSAPFAQFGYNMAKAFNLLIAVLTLILSARIANRLFPGSSLFTIILIAFSPVYFLISASCLTEILFSFVLVAAVYLFLGKRFVLAAIILSFLPMVRSEGVVILPVFAVALFLSRSYRSIPFLLIGTVFYSIIGYFVFGDFFWLFNKLPYSLGESLYGSGSLLHFVKHSHSIFGIPLLLLIVAGLLTWGTGILKNFSLQKPNTILFILIAGSWITYFAAHSYVWWKGTGGSLGLTRVMAGIVPLAALTGMKFFEFVSQKIKSKTIVYGVFTVLAVLQVIMLFSRHNLMLKADPTEQLIKKSTDYIRLNDEGEKVFYFNPLVIHYLELDPYDTEQCNWWVADKQQPSNTLDWGDLLVWDAHFGPNEGGVQLENLENDPYLGKIKSFYPVEKIVVLGGYDYSVQIFKKSREKNPTDSATLKLERLLTFENFNDDKIIDVDGEKVFRMDETIEFSPGITVMEYEIEQIDFLDFDVSLDYRSNENIGKDEVLLIFSVGHDGNNLRYEKKELLTTGTDWKTVQITSKIPADLPESTSFNVYVWNKDRKNIELKTLELRIQSY